MIECEEKENVKVNKLMKIVPPCSKSKNIPLNSNDVMLQYGMVRDVEIHTCEAAEHISKPNVVQLHRLEFSSAKK